MLADPTWHPLAAGAVWWLVNGLLVITHAVLGQRLFHRVREWDRMFERFVLAPRYEWLFRTRVLGFED